MILPPLAAVLAVFGPIFFALSVQGYDPMLGLFEDSLNEVDSPMTAKVVEGVVPPWLNGSLFRVGPSQFSSPGRNVTHMFDGLASVHRWVFVQGAVSFQSRFLRSAVFKATRASGKFPKSRTIGPVEPPFGLFEATCADDNTNVNVFQEAGPNGSLLVLTDTTVTNAVDPGSLATEGTIKHSDQLWDALLSPAHPHRDAADGSFLGVAAFANLLGPSKLWVFRMGSDRKRVPFGAVTLQFAPYMHSFALTEHYAVVALFPAHLNLGRVIAYDPLSSAFEWKGDELNTTILVFDRRKTDSAPPVATFSAPPFFAFHHANAYEDGEQLVLDMCAYPDMSLMTDPHSFGYLSVVRNATARAAASPRPWLRRLRLDLGRGGAAVGVEDMQATDTNGTVYWFDFPKVNPTRDGKPYCFVYGAAFRASGTSAIVKMDVCEATQAGARGGPTATVWQAATLVGSEPIVVARPGGSSEDDGVLLVQAFNAETQLSDLVVLNATTMKVVAHVGGVMRVPFDLHGEFVQDG